MISDELPAWSLEAEGAVPAPLRSDWPQPLDRAWAFGDGRGAGVRVAIVDSGVDAGHPVLAGALERAVVVALGEDGRTTVEQDAEGDVSGHGTACAGIIPRARPRLRADQRAGARRRPHRLRRRASRRAALGGARGPPHRQPLALDDQAARAEALRDLADAAYFGGCLLVASAHNMPVDSWPWRFAPVLSVASHAGDDPEAYFYNPRPPVEFHARGMDVEVAWAAGATIRASGNSFATPHMAGMAAARVLGAHPGLLPFEVKTALHLSADNVRRS